jgi:TetR/AcrR family transcriptional regulator
MTRHRKSEGATRERILKAATEHFAERGYDGARTQAIADAAGVNKAMLYYHFRDKRHLYRETLKSHFLEIVRDIVPSFIDTSREPRERVMVIVQAYTRFLRNHPHMRALMLREMATGAREVIAVIGEIRQEIPALDPHALLAGLREMMAGGQIREEDPRQVFLHLISLALFPHIARPLIAFLAELTPEELDRLLDERPAAVARLLENGLIITEVS